MPKDGPVLVSFIKEPGADWLDPANRLELKEGYELTRKDNQGLYEYNSQTGWDGRGPANSQWAEGTPEDTTGADEIEWYDWVDAVNQSPPEMVGNTYTIKIVSENGTKYDEYYSFTGDSWQSGEEPDEEGNTGGWSATWYFAGYGQDLAQEKPHVYENVYGLSTSLPVWAYTQHYGDVLDTDKALALQNVMYDSQIDDADIYIEFINAHKDDTEDPEEGVVEAYVTSKGYDEGTEDHERQVNNLMNILRDMIKNKC